MNIQIPVVYSQNMAKLRIDHIFNKFFKHQTLIPTLNAKTRVEHSNLSWNCHICALSRYASPLTFILDKTVVLYSFCREKKECKIRHLIWTLQDKEQRMAFWSMHLEAFFYLLHKNIHKYLYIGLLIKIVSFLYSRSGENRETTKKWLINEHESISNKIRLRLMW